MDQFKNFASSQLAAGITSADLAASVLIGDGARFPAAPFSATIWNKTDHANPSDDVDHEFVLVTAVSGDNFDITRAQEGTTAADHNTSGKAYGVVAGVTAGLFAYISQMLGVRGTRSLSGTAAQEFASLTLDFDGDAAGGFLEAVVISTDDSPATNVVSIRQAFVVARDSSRGDSAALSETNIVAIQSDAIPTWDLSVTVASHVATFSVKPEIDLPWTLLSQTMFFTIYDALGHVITLL